MIRLVNVNLYIVLFKGRIQTFQTIQVSISSTIRGIRQYFPLWYSVKCASTYVIVLSSYSAYGKILPKHCSALEYIFASIFLKYCDVTSVKTCYERIAPLLRFFSSQSEEDLISLDEYVENMKPEEKDICYVASDSMTSAKNTPFLEKHVEKDIEVLFFVDPIDQVAIQNLKSYKYKTFVNIIKEDLDLGDKNEEKEKEMKEEYGQTCDWIKKCLGDKVANVQVSTRLTTSPCILATGKFG